MVHKAVHLKLLIKSVKELSLFFFLNTVFLFVTGTEGSRASSPVAGAGVPV